MPNELRKWYIQMAVCAVICIIEIVVCIGLVR